MLCLPMGRDQDDTAARVVHAGAGIRLKPHASPATIARGVARLLNEASFRQGAVRLRAAIAEEQRRTDVGTEIEKVARVAATAHGVPRAWLG